MVSLSKILEKHSEDLAKYRRLLFPLMHFDVITGFNLYEKRTVPQSKFTINYLHSELDEDSEHRQELEQKIRTHFKSLSLHKVEFEKIDRHSSYKLKQGWNAPRYYDIYGDKLSEEMLKKARLNNETIIGVAFQNDLEILLNNAKEFRYVLEIFRKHFNYYCVHQKTGEFIRDGHGNKIVNKDKVIDSWEVPLIIIKTSQLELTEAYPRISEVKIQENEYFLSILVGNRKNLFCKVLDFTVRKYVEEPVATNKVFANWINKGAYGQKYKKFVSQFNGHIRNLF